MHRLGHDQNVLHTTEYGYAAGLPRGWPEVALIARYVLVRVVRAAGFG
jgi:hypothetical protein